VRLTLNDEDAGMKWFNLFVIAAALFLLSACGGPKNLFVLMPDADGNVGEITVKNDAGEQVVTTAGTAVKVKDQKTAPAPPEPMAEKEIQKTFQHTMDATPRPAAQFVLQFKSGTSTLTRISQALLPQILATIQKRQPCDVRIIGHTDTAGNAEKNWELGLKRAKNVRQLLIDKGAAGDQIEAVSHGEKDLHVPTPDNVAEPGNRRVEVRIR
jgi:outer membrane protein OmpA-like peptidoglycan-associated protein